MARHDTRTYSGHWDAYYHGQEHPPPPPRWPWLRDVILATPIGILLGAGVGFRITNGYWPIAAAIGIVAFVLHAGIVGVGQLSDITRQTRADLRLITIVGVSAIVLSLAVAWLVTR